MYAFDKLFIQDVLYLQPIVDDGSAQVIAAIVWVDAFTAIYFTIEYVVRFACSPKKLKFFIDPMNLVDLFAILPYFLSMVLEHLSEFHIIGKTGKVNICINYSYVTVKSHVFLFTYEYIYANSKLIRINKNSSYDSFQNNCY